MAQPIIASGPQPPQPGEEVSALAKLGFVAAGVAAGGFIPFKGNRLWDTYLKGIRAVETGFPAAILRTFRISEFLSPLESWSKINVPQNILASGGKYAEYLQTLFGSGVDDIALKRSGSIFGEVTTGGKAVGMGIQITAGSQKGSAVADYFARLSGVELGVHESLNDALLRSKWVQSRSSLPYGEWLELLEPHARREKLILGARYREKLRILGKDFTLSTKAQRGLAKLEITGKLLRAKAATTAGRLNILLSKPLEVPVIGGALQKIPIIRSMAVKPGSAMQMLGRFTKKALIAGAVWKGLEYYDYLRANESPWATALGGAAGALAGGVLLKRLGTRFSAGGMLVGAAVGLYTALSPRFDEGLFHGAATMVTDTNLLRAEASESIGLTESLREQERVTPGLMSPVTALAFGAIGAMGVGFTDYGMFMGAAAKERWKSGGQIANVFEALRETRKVGLEKKLAGSKIIQGLRKVPGIKSLTKGPIGLGFLAGIAAWTVASSGLSLLSGNVGAAIPGLNLLGTTDTPEELQEVYSGEKDVAVRKGRWWEFGRCIASRCVIPLYNQQVKEAKDVNIGDKLLSSDGLFCCVMNIWKRKHSGLSYSIYSTLNKNIPTSVTGNHKIPVLTKEFTYSYEVVEKESRAINVGEYVQIPISKLKETRTELISENLIKTGMFLIGKDTLLPAQKNLHSGKVQRSRGSSIPRIIKLTPELGRLFGYFLAEGNLSYKDTAPHMVETVHAKSERWIVDDIISISEKEFGITPTVRFRKGKKEVHEGCWIVRICSSLLARIYYEIFYNSDRQQDKIFPQIFMSAPKDFKEQLVEGYWLGDGHLDGVSKILSSCREDFLLKTQAILLNLGYYPTINTFEKNDYRGRYKLRWDQYGRYNGRGFHNNFRWHNDKLYVKVQKITIEEYNGMVYDFEVDHPDHLFVAGTFLVHNSTAYGGGRIEHYRPHFLHRLKSRAYQKGIYGSEEERWEYDPMLHPLKALFGSDKWKYHYERKYQYERPAPLTGTYGEDVPFIGPMVAATLGKLLKPRKQVRPREWDYGKGEYRHLPDVRGETEPAYELGGLKPGAPVEPEEGSQLLNELMYRRREAVGLVGFAEGAIQKSITGREEFFQNQQTMGIMGKETGSEYWLWSHLNIGGGMGTTEPIRRFIPHTRNYLESYNPLENTMPSWMPTDYFLDLKHGNPFQKIKEAEIRLPGPGYAALHPEVTDVRPEEYPLAHRIKILGDVAMWSNEYKSALSKGKRNITRMSDQEKQMIKTTEEQVRAKKKRRVFDEYRFDRDKLTSQDVTVTDVVSPRNIRTAEFGDMTVELQGVGAVENMTAAMERAQGVLQGQKLKLYMPTMESRRYDRVKSGGRLKAVAMLGDQDYGQYMAREGLVKSKELKDEFEQLRFSRAQRAAGTMSEALLHSADTPLEMLTPISPASKLIRKRTAIEEYVATEAVGTGNAFWDRPMENFLRPAANMTLHGLGFSGIPEEIRQRRDINEYFDMLKWTKSERAEQQARQENRWSDVKEQQQLQQETLFGVDVFGSPTKLMKALPRRERDFYTSFVAAKTEEERREIFQMIPDNERRMYLAQWMRQEEETVIAKKEGKIAQDHEDQVLVAAKFARKSEGFSISPDLEEEWMQETGGRIPYDEWIRERKAQEYFATHSLPGADWLGWCVPEDQIILTSDKSILAKDVVIGTEVKTLNGYQKVKNIFSREAVDKMVTVKARHNNLYEMKATSNHLVLSLQDKDYSLEWKKISSLDTDSYLPLPLLEYSENDPLFDLADIPGIRESFNVKEEVISVKAGRNNPINRFVQMDESLAWLLGYYLAEGNVWQVKDRLRGVQFTSHIEEKPLLELANRIVKNKFGLTGKIREKHRDTGTSAYLVISSGLFGYIVQFWLGRFCDQKHPPKWLSEITHKSQVALLEGLLDGDATKDGRHRLVLANYQLCQMARAIWESQGIGASIRFVARKNGKKQYAVEPLTSSRNVLFGNSFVAYRVASVEEEDFTGPVLDFEVEDEHMYCSPIGIYHNSPSVDMDDVKLKYVEMQGLDHHDFDLWGARRRSLARKPYINEELIRAMERQDKVSQIAKTRVNAKAVAKMHGGQDARVNVQRIAANIKEDYDFDVTDKRQGLVEETYKYMGVR